MSKDKLTLDQQEIACRLFASRPQVLPGTRVIIDTNKRLAWYVAVTEAMDELGLKSPTQVNAFCGLAGVPD